jgi:hypothetical protein
VDKPSRAPFGLHDLFVEMTHGELRIGHAGQISQPAFRPASARLSKAAGTLRPPHAAPQAMGVEFVALMVRETKLPLAEARGRALDVSLRRRARPGWRCRAWRRCGRGAPSQSRGDEHPLADVGIGEPFGHELHDSQLSRGEAFPAASRASSLSPRASYPCGGLADRELLALRVRALVRVGAERLPYCVCEMRVMGMVGCRPREPQLGGANRVLPTPPAPVSVSSRVSVSASRSCSSSRPRPTELVMIGQVVGKRVQRAQRVNLDLGVRRREREHILGRPRSRRRCTPQSTSSTPSGR